MSSASESSEPGVPAESGAQGERILIVEDDRAARLGLTELIRAWGYVADAAADGEEALGKITTFRPGIVLTDLVMPRMDGLGLLRALQDQLSDLCVVILTAQGTVETAVQAIKEGAYDYLTKPVDPSRLEILLAKAVERQATRREVHVLRRQLRDQGSFGRIIGNTPAVRKLYRTIEQAAPTNASVLIWGESGTGKELVAQTIHQLSERAQQPYIAINCAAIPETLLESEIFGHEKGAFTGAIERRLGCFELAHRGTLFLDEIAEMVPVTQVKLLRVLQERTFRRLGGRTEQQVDVRIIAATNVNPLDAVQKGKLREDLYYRLNVLRLRVPPLREREGDVELLAQAMFERFAQRAGKRIRGFSRAAMDRMVAHPWPGNVRELVNRVQRGVVMCEGRLIAPADLGLERRAASRTLGTLEQSREQAEQNAIRDALIRNRSVIRASAALGISRMTLYRRMAKYGLKPKDLPHA